MTTSAPAKPPQFEPPEKHVNEAVLAAQLGLEICADNFPTLLAANFLVALDGHDRRLKHEFFEDVLVLTYNFQNRMTRIAELGTILETIMEGGDVEEKLKSEMKQHLEQAEIHRKNIQQVLKLFGEMRGPEDTVS